MRQNLFGSLEKTRYLARSDNLSILIYAGTFISYSVRLMYEQLNVYLALEVKACAHTCTLPLVLRPFAKGEKVLMFFFLCLCLSVALATYLVDILDGL